jgi:hypothetical protein
MIDRVDNLLMQLEIEDIVIELNVFLVNVREAAPLVVSGYFKLIL